MGLPTTFKKSERLTSRRAIEDIFNRKGKSIRSGPLLFIYLKTDLDTVYPAQILISVSKRKFNKAHDRNKIKRKIKEVYRLSKAQIYEHIQTSQNKYALALLYLDKEAPSYQSLEEHIKNIIDEFVKRPA